MSFKTRTNHHNTFAIGDVHGCYHTLMQLIDELPQKAKLIFVGDLCDKGNFSKEVIEYVIENKHECILGNHEYLMLKNIDDKNSKWAKKTYMGGYKTLESYKDEKELLSKHLNWIQTLPSYIIKANYLITHAYGLPYFKRRDEEKSKKPLMSNRLNDYKKWGHDWEKGWSSYEVFNIFGHDYGSKPISDKNYHNIDSGCVYGEELTAFNLETKELISVRTDERDICTFEKGFNFLPDIESPYGFTIKAPDSYPQGWTSLHSDTKYLCINFTKHTKSGQVHKSYLFDKDKNHFSWEQRHKQIKDKLEIKEFENGYKVERTREINFEKQHELTHDKLYKDEELIKESNSLVTSGTWGEIDFIYKRYINEKQEEKEKEDEKLEKVNTFLSKNKEEQKEQISNEVIYITMKHIFHGAIRDAGPLKELPLKYFKNQYKKINPKLFDELYIHALTVFALVQNESECYKNVNVQKYVKTQASKHNLNQAFVKYFDDSVKIDTNKILG